MHCSVFHDVVSFIVYDAMLIALIENYNACFESIICAGAWGKVPSLYTGVCNLNAS